MSDQRFNSIEAAEEFLTSRGFHLVPGSCDWTNKAGDDAGVYPIEGSWGQIKAWRVEINRRVASI